VCKFPLERELDAPIETEVPRLSRLGTHEKFAVNLKDKWKGEMKALRQGRAHPTRLRRADVIRSDYGTSVSIVILLNKGNRLRTCTYQEGICNEGSSRMWHLDPRVRCGGGGPLLARDEYGPSRITAKELSRSPSGNQGADVYGCPDGLTD
jgi:hypothetical protein